MTKESVTDIKPPYLTWATFKNLIKGFREGVLPSRIDRSAMPGTANGVQTYLLSALKFFGLIDENGVPTNDFTILVEAKDGDKRRVEWKRIMERSYAFILDNGLDLQRATESQLHEKFREKGLDGATLRKCHTFFSNAAEAAGIVLGPHAKSSTKSSGGSGAPRKKYARKAANKDGVTGTGAGNGTPPNPPARNMREMILDKFPDFDPEWSPELKAAWFKDFSELRKWGEETK